MQNSVISAIATPSGTGGVAIIRLSGEGSLAIAEKMFTPTGKTKVMDFVPRTMYAGEIKADGFTDYGMCVYFKAPHSFTGEDSVEFHCHGGVQIARGVLKATVNFGASLAGRGEFTKRAFLNGKLSLSSAEGMIDMINADSLAELRAGCMMYSEKLTNKVSSVRAELTEILASIAADVDFPEEDIERDELSTVRERLEAVLADINKILAGYETGKRIKSGVTVALCGCPNVGKSSLLNALLGYGKAIVSSIAGTTRDAVEGSVEIDGVKFNLVDTAGIREQAGEIENRGIEIAERYISSADIILQVSDGVNGEVELPPHTGKVLKIFNKTDICAPEQGKYDVCVSAERGDGLDELKELLRLALPSDFSEDKAYIVEERHFNALTRAAESLSSAIEAVGVFPLDAISLDITEAWSALGEITGETATEEIINEVFAKFCVGK